MWSLDTFFGFTIGILTVVATISTWLLLLMRAELGKRIHAEVDPEITRLEERIDRLTNGRRDQQ